MDYVVFMQSGEKYYMTAENKEALSLSGEEGLTFTDTRTGQTVTIYRNKVSSIASASELQK